MSRTRSVAVLALYSLFPLAGCGGEAAPRPPDQPIELAEPPVPAEEQPPPELEQAAAAYISAWNGDDAGAVSAFFIDDAVVRDDDSTYTGRPAIHERWVVPFLPVVSDLQTTNARYSRTGEDYVATEDFTFTAAGEGGATQQVSGQAELTWTRTPDGSWKLRSETIRSQAP